MSVFTSTVLTFTLHFQVWCGFVCSLSKHCVVSKIARLTLKKDAKKCCTSEKTIDFGSLSIRRGPSSPLKNVFEHMIISARSQWEQIIPDQPRTKEPNYEHLLGISFL